VTGTREQRFLPALIGDGRPLIAVTGLALLLSGLFAFFLSATKHFLPHDIAYLGMTADALCGINECRILRPGPPQQAEAGVKPVEGPHAGHQPAN
jgi:hypothetical protein